MKALHDSEERYHILVDNMADVVFTVDLKGAFTFCAPQAEKMTGYSVKQLLSMNITQLIAPEYSAYTQERLQRRIRGEKGLKPQELEIIRADGTRLPIEINTTLLLEKKKPNGVQGIARDITERKQMENALRESEERHRGLFENSKDAITINTPEGLYVDFNQAYLELLGYSRDELSELKAVDVYANLEDRDRFRREIERNGFVKDFEVQIRRKDGTLRDCLLTSTAWRDKKGHIVGYQGILRDITERRQLEQMRERFISAVTHELRTPLVPVKANVDFVLSGKLGQLPETAEASLKLAQRNVNRLQCLVDELLDTQRLSSGRFQLDVKETDFLMVMEETLSELKPIFDEKKQSLHVEVPHDSLPIWGDRNRLSQVLVNLLGNASKYAPEHGVVTVRVEDKADTIQVQISDSGIGIRKEDLSRVFEPFAAIQKSTYVKGTGLGLSISKGIIEAHGGQVWAYSEGEGKGATFTFTIPKGRKEVG